MGFGLVEYSKFLIDNGIEMLAVATTEDAIALREAGIKGEIIILGYTPVCQKNDIIKYDIDKNYSDEFSIFNNKSSTFFNLSSITN